jgi:hypothetical protein
MTNQHDLNLLSGRVRYAADILEEIGRKLELPKPQYINWTADELRAEANTAAEEEDDVAAIEELAKAMFGVVVTLTWEDATPWTQQSYRLRAEQLYRDGWRRT